MQIRNDIQKTVISSAEKRKKMNNLKRYLSKNYDLYILMIPGVIFLLIFKYLPLMGNVIAFKDFDINLGNNMLEAIFKSKWVGLGQFEKLFSDPDAIRAVFNTFIISFYKIVFLFPIPILLALFMNEINNSVFKRAAQTVIYFPNFLSWAIIAGLFIQILQADGLVNALLHITGDNKISYLLENRFFRTILVATDGWKSAGFAAIIYMAAIATIDPELYEAASIDGGGRFHKMWHITLPGIASTIVMVFTLTVGIQIAYGSFEQILVFYNPMVYQTGDIIQTFAYRKGLGTLDFSFSTAVGMLNNIVAVLFIYLSNVFCKKVFGKSIW